MQKSKLLKQKLEEIYKEFINNKILNHIKHLNIIKYNLYKNELMIYINPHEVKKFNENYIKHNYNNWFGNELLELLNKYYYKNSYQFNLTELSFSKFNQFKKCKRKNLTTHNLILNLCRI